MGLSVQHGAKTELRRIRILEWFESQQGWAAQRNMADQMTSDPLFRHDIWFLDEIGLIEVQNALGMVAEVHARITTEGRKMLEQIRTRRSQTLQWKRTPWAFMSSPKGEMEDLRDAARDGALRARVLPVGMEFWGAKPVASLDTCYAELEKCDVVVLVVGHRYGYEHSTLGKAYTELEFEKAIELGIPVLAFISKSMKMDPQKVDPDDLAKLQGFKKRLQESDQVTFAEYESPQELDKLVHQSLREWLDEEMKLSGQ